MAQFSGEFNVGDTIRMKYDCSGSIAGNTYILTRCQVRGCINELVALSYKSDHGCSCQSSWEFISSADNTMNRIVLTESQKKNLSKDAQALVEAGYYTGNLQRVSDTHLLNFLNDIFEADYAKKAKAELAADDAKKAAQAAV